jgi:acyl carrier protein
MTTAPGDETEAIASRIESFVREIGQIGADEDQFARDSNLYEEGWLDSMGSMRLLDFLESVFEITLSDDDLMSPQFTTINGMSEIIRAAQRSGAMVTGR